MDINLVTVLQGATLLVGGGGIYAIIKKLFSSNKVKELSDIIGQMRGQLEEAYRRIELLEKANRTRLLIEDRNVILEISMAHGKSCSYFETCPCPIHKKFNELNSEKENN